MPPRKKQKQKQSRSIQCVGCGRWFSSQGYSQHLSHHVNQACREACGKESGLRQEKAAAAAVLGKLGVIGQKLDPAVITTVANQLLDNLEMEAKEEADNASSTNSENDGKPKVPPVLEVEFEQDVSDESTAGVDTTILDSFVSYAEKGQKDFAKLSKDEISGVKLLRIMYMKRAPLNAYEELQKWRSMAAPRVSGSTGFPLQDNNDPVSMGEFSREGLMSKLYNRYNLKEPFQVKVQLPHSKAVVKIVCHDFKDQVTSLLTDPRINPNTDYVFHNDDPFSPPPENFEFVEDINSGQAYVATYKALIEEDSDQVLLGIPFYMDAAVTGQYDHLPVKALKFTLSIFNKQTRDKEYAWRILGYITHFVKEDTVGRQLFVDSGHMDVGLDIFDSDTDDESTLSEATGSSTGRSMDDDDDDNDDDNDNGNIGTSETESEPEQEAPHHDDLSSCSGSTASTAVKAQDFHTQLDTILEHSGYKAIQESGFKWKLNRNGVIQLCHFVLFVPMVKGDTDEHDRHCGSYTNRNANVAQLCRYCTCPTDDSDNPRANYPMKTQAAIQSYVDAGDEDALKALSQYYIQNAWYSIRFGQHNNMGIHGACPSEMLHALLLGWYKYTRNMFFAQVGKDSALSDVINAIAKQYGTFFRHQSDRDLPRTNFSKGIKKGKLMAREHTGLLLILLTVLRSTAGHEALLTSRNRKFRKQASIDDWVMLLETLLGWECWLRQDRIAIFEIKRSRRKHQYILALFKKIGNRQEGMGMKLMKYHVVVHLHHDMLWFGPPIVVDTGANESHHKSSKTAARQTQKNARKFELQTAIRHTDQLAVDLAMCEIDDGLKIWEYLLLDDDGSRTGSSDNGSTNSSENKEESNEPVYEEPAVTVANGGTTFKFCIINEDDTDYFTYLPYKSRSKYRDRMTWDPQLVTFIGVEILDNIPEWDSIIGFSCHRRNEQIFHAHPNYRGEGPWHDWVMVNWGAPFGIQPAHIWTFLDLSNLPGNTNIDFGDGTRLNKPGTYAVVESALPNENEEEVERSQLLMPYKKITNSLEPLKRKFWLVDVEAFHAPTCIVPDMGGAKDAFLRLRTRSQWLELYSEWLRSPHQSIDDVLGGQN